MNTPKFEDFVEMGSPIDYYRLQELLQKNGVLLLDPDSGNIISGQVNLPIIALVDTLKIRSNQRSLGFIPTPEPVKTDYKNLDADAFLCPEGLLTDKEVDYPFFIIKVVDGREMARWSDLAFLVGTQMGKETDGNLVPTILMGVMSLSQPDESEPKSAITAVLRKYQKYGFSDKT